MDKINYHLSCSKRSIIFTALFLNTIVVRRIGIIKKRKMKHSKYYLNFTEIKLNNLT